MVFNGTLFDRELVSGSYKWLFFFLRSSQLLFCRNFDHFRHKFVFLVFSGSPVSSKIFNSLLTITLHYLLLPLLPFISLHYLLLPFISLHYPLLPFITLHYLLLPFITLHYSSLPCFTLHYPLLPFITLHYPTLPCINLYYPALPFKFHNIFSNFVRGLLTD